MDASLKKNWYIQYYFHDPNFKKEFPRGKYCIVKGGVNQFKSITDRRDSIKVLLEEVIKQLTVEGYNPILKKAIAPACPVDDTDYLIHPLTPFSKALQTAFDQFKGDSKEDLKSSLKYLQLSIKDMKYDDCPVEKIKRRHLVRILENCEKIKKQVGGIWSNNQYNHYRTALLILYRIFVKYETVEANIVTDMEIKNHAAEPRRPLTVEQRELIAYRLEHNNPRFWIFINIFFHSGARLTEMARVQGKHVNVERQEVTYLVKKGKSWEWVTRPIADEAVPFWRIALEGCGPGQYVFAKGLMSGDVPINSDQYTRRWRVWIMKPVADEDTKFDPKCKKERIDFMKVKLYDLKHTRTTELGDKLDEQFKKIDEQLAKANGHTTDKMAKKIYDLRNKQRKDDKIKSAHVKFA
ncbi:MAG: hypothetical protein EPN37_07295 [Chitinophagaceae bacterium]|nr:MAG: hypothetical protein EPN37_07295 [Chitinophagaceae bacterium]